MRVGGKSTETLEAIGSNNHFFISVWRALFNVGVEGEKKKRKANQCYAAGNHGVPPERENHTTAWKLRYLLDFIWNA